LVASGSVTFSPGTSGAHPPFRIFANTAGTSESVGNAAGSSNGAQAGEAFLIRRALSADEVMGVYNSGIVPTFQPQEESDTRDTQKDNIGAISTDAPILRVTSWNATDSANPSGMRHTESGSHPAFIKVIGTGSGIVFNGAKLNKVSDPVALSIRNLSSGQYVSGILVWIQDDSALAGVNGWEISARIKSEWTPNLNMESGGGYLARSLGAASSVLRSDGGLTISGVVAQSNVASGEPEVSQYIYLALHTNSDFTIGTYGPSNWTIRISSDFVSV
jgi:hypothetical protein